eukprot:SAG11_NODE_855_length_6868_cov_3.086128_9_plen_91_part_00
MIVWLAASNPTIGQLGTVQAMLCGSAATLLAALSARSELHRFIVRPISISRPHRLAASFLASFLSIHPLPTRPHKSLLFRSCDAFSFQVR